LVLKCISKKKKKSKLRKSR